MDMSQHPWIQNYTDFEAVLVCENELETWSKDSIKRAFQTFQFRDISKDEETIEMKHFDTGSIVQYEGNVMAIRFSENLDEMLGDLVLTLSGLGWARASAYHHEDTLNMFLKDIGRAIPAHVSFEVSAAHLSENMLQHPQAALLLANARGTATQRNEQLNIISQELSMLQTSGQNAAALKATGPIILLDDDDGDTLFPDRFEVRSDVTLPAPVNTAFAASEEGAEPFIFTLPDEPDALQPLTSPGINAEVQTVAEDPASNVYPFTPASPAKIQASGLPPNILRLGKGLVCFDTTDLPLSEASLPDHLGQDALETGEYIHVYPGRINSPLRWDMLGEIPLDNLFFAETLVECMHLRIPNVVAFSRLIAALLDQHAPTSHREMLETLLKIQIYKDDRAREPSSCTLPMACTKTAELMYLHADFKPAINALLNKSLDLSLIPNGKAFLDLWSGESDIGSFTLRELKARVNPFVYIVHVSTNDIRMARWIANTLYALTLHHQSKPGILDTPQNMS